MGEVRFTIYTLLRVVNLRKYRAKLWYKPVKKASQTLKLDDETASEPTTLEEEPINFKELEAELTEVEEDPESSEKEESVKGILFLARIKIEYFFKS